jgi:hypothetical protein
MDYYETISNDYRFGRVLDHLIERYMPNDLRPLVEYLAAKHGLKVEGIYLENYKAPDRIVVVDGKLPIEDLKSRFPEGNGICYGDGCVQSDKTFSTLEGR